MEAAVNVSLAANPVFAYAPLYRNFTLEFVADWTIRRGSGERCRWGRACGANRVGAARGQPAVGLHSLPLWHLQLHAGAGAANLRQLPCLSTWCDVAAGTHLALSSGQF